MVMLRALYGKLTLELRIRTCYTKIPHLNGMRLIWFIYRIHIILCYHIRNPMLVSFKTIQLSMIYKNVWIKNR